MIGIKQKTKQEDWIPVLNHFYSNRDMDRAKKLVDEASQKVVDLGFNLDDVAYGWSGGKDSQALRVIMENVGVEDCYLAISSLEYPDFLAWATNEMPERLMIILNESVNMDWLVNNQAMLFPNTIGASRWFQKIQGSGRRKYIKKTDKKLILLGRRKADNNQKPDYHNGGARIVSPIYNWTHEDVLCVLGAFEMSLPPCYWWPRGFQVGTGSWAARQWTGNYENGWREVHEIDSKIVHMAAKRIHSARLFLEKIDEL